MLKCNKTLKYLQQLFFIYIILQFFVWFYNFTLFIFSRNFYETFRIIISCDQTLDICILLQFVSCYFINKLIVLL